MTKENKKMSDVKIKSLYIQGDELFMLRIFEIVRNNLGTGINAFGINPPEPDHQDD